MDTHNSAAAPPRGREKRRLWTWFLGGAFLLAAAAFGGWYALAPPVLAATLPDGVDPAVAQEVATARWAIRRAPYADGPRGRLGMILQGMEMNTEAAAFYAQAEQLNPAEPRWPYLHALVTIDDPPTAMALLRRAADLTAGRPDVPDMPLLKWGDACLNQGQLDDAEAAYRRLLEHQPEHAQAHLSLARLAILRNQFDDALAHLKRCAGHPATRKAAAGLLAQVHQRRGEAAEAVEATEQARKLPADDPWPDPWWDDARFALAGRRARLYQLQELQKQGRQRERAELLHKTVKEYPDFGWAYLGHNRFKEGKLAEAEQAYRKALEYNPSYIEGHYELGKVLMAQKKFPDAAESFRRILELEPSHGGACRALAVCALKTGDRDEAVRRLRQVLHYMPHDAEAHRDLGELLAGQGQTQEALHHLALAVSLDPRDAKARELLEKARGGPGKGSP